VRVTDDHAHANPVKGLGFVEVAKRFKEAGALPLSLPSALVALLCVSDLVRELLTGLRGGAEGRSRGFGYVKALALLGVHRCRVVNTL
jgi:predicted urease superfamily metal-dependent hydrolase